MELTWPILIGTAMADSINPLTYAFLIFLYKHHQKAKKSQSSSDQHVGAFIAGVFVTNLLLGLTFIPLIIIASSITPNSYKFIGVISILAGILTAKDYFTPVLKKHKPHKAWRLQNYKEKISQSLATSFALGAIITLAEVFISGTTYLASLSIAIKTSFATTPTILLTAYNFTYILPLVILGQYLKHNIDTHRFQIFKHHHKNSYILGSGMLLISLGIWLLFG